MIQNKEDLFSKFRISKKSKTIQKRTKNIIEVNDEYKQQSEVWDISSIWSNIFIYTDHKDLVEFNTVCKKWNHLTNPIIHKTIRLNRKWDYKKNARDNRSCHYAITDAETVECIANNAKNAHFVKDFHYMYDLKPQRAIEVFETFRFISKLIIEKCDMSQDQFLGMISPLTQLQELTLKSLTIKKIIYKRLYKEVVQLPSTLNKLSLSISLTGNPELFIQTINSHKNLVEFDCSTYYNDEFLMPFYKPYPNLLKFNYLNTHLQSQQSLIKVFEQNHQLTSLKLSLSCWSSELTNYISKYLTNLDQLDFTEYTRFNQDHTDLNLKFSQPTKIRKLSLNWYRLSNCSLDSILENCPYLEELKLNRSKNYHQSNSEISFNLSKFAKVKKLNFNCENLSVSSLSSLLLNCPYLNELEINLPVRWREVMNEIYTKSLNLQKLAIYPSYLIQWSEMDSFFQEFCQSEFFTNRFKINSTLTHLTLNRFKAQHYKAEYFKNFEKLKSIKYTAQKYHNYRIFRKKYKNYMNLWPGYKMISNDGKSEYELEFKKIIS